ncbi:MAG: two-component system, OmpR family, sensor kinase [Candidatus Eremiobacteraeota bacterium]|jgi:signal transduction histidine kinase|nr:two-component system, OmpR family, sensor kinase [Candidatus Eremiobacteraeota bacterium]
MTLRSRLTLLSAAAVGVLLVLVAVVVTRLAFALVAQPTLAAVAQGVAAAEAVAAAHPNDASDAVVASAIDAAKRPGVIAFAGHADGRGGPSGRGPDASRGGPGRPKSGPPAAATQVSLASLLGLRPRHVFLAGGKAEILVAPDLQLLEPTIRLYLESLAFSVVVAFVAAWLFGRWIAAQAIAPLVTVTGELHRFAQGDFTPRHVSGADRSELGALIEAYNGATAQVAAAFAERVRVEEQMRRFVADAGHELRTPLTVVSAFIDVLERGGLADADIRARAFPTLRTETRRMRRLVERLMALARLERPEAGSTEVVDVAEIADGAVAEVLAARRGEVSLAVAADETRVLTDRGELHEAIGNLVDNAVKYGAGSPVRVEIRRENDNVVVRVSDGGPGIPENERTHVFERFFRGERTAGIEGSGLGLAIVERAAARCGGTVRLEDTTAGTTFALVLPLMRAARGENAALHLA